MRISGKVVVLTVGLLCGVVHSQERTSRPIVVTVSYVTTQSVYLDGGKNRSLAPGDTGTVLRHSAVAVRLVITAVSSSSSVARTLAVGDSVTLGDSVSFAALSPATRVTIVPGDTAQKVVGVVGGVRSTPGIIHGRIALQYAGSGEVGGEASLSRPSLLLHLDAGPISGTSIRFSLHGRVDGSLGNTAGSMGNQGTTLRLYDLTLAQDDPRMWYGFSVGRISSAYVGGLGLVDGGQVFLRSGKATVGVLGGLQPDYRTSGFATESQKLAGFINYAWADGSSVRGGSTVAYGQQLYRGALDRDFLYVQNSAAFSTTLFLYQNTEIDLHRREGDGRKSDFRLTNTFLTLNYQPLDWMTANVGYDASRRIEFLQSDKTVVDSLLDRDLRQGFRGSLYFRLPLKIALSVLGGYRLPAGGLPAGFSAGSGMRLSDIAGSTFSLGGQYLRITSPYTDGSDITGDLEFAPMQGILVSLRWDQYAFTPLGIDQGDGRVVISTLTGSASWNVMRGWYVALYADRVRESDRLLYRIFAESGFHF